MKPLAVLSQCPTVKTLIRRGVARLYSGANRASVCHGLVVFNLNDIIVFVVDGVAIFTGHAQHLVAPVVSGHHSKAVTPKGGRFALQMVPLV